MRAVIRSFFAILLFVWTTTATAFVGPWSSNHRILAGLHHKQPPRDLRTWSTAEAPSTTTFSRAASTAVESITTPKGSTHAWEVHKFGGASLATAELYRTVGDLLLNQAKDEKRGRGHGHVPTMAVVSARGGMTDLLVHVVDSALVDFDQAQTALEDAVQSQIALLHELAPPDITAPIEARFRKDAQDILSVVQSLRMINTVPAVTMEVVTGFGEIWSAQTLYAYLQTKNVPCDWIDARDILVVASGDSNAGLGEKGAASTGGVEPVWDETFDRLNHWWNTVGVERGFQDLDYSTASPIVIVTGFVATTDKGVPTTLKRSGSDYSATIFAKLAAASRVTMWKNVDGVYTADPRRVPEAFPIKSLKYDEAMELAYFGAQVLHPSAMVPCIDNQIPVYVRNIFNPSFEGTVIRGRCPTLKDVNNDSKVKNWRSKSGEIPIKGITSVDKVALVTLEGASTIGGPDVAERFTGAMSNAGINVLIITQASSESSITVAVPENEGTTALEALKRAFELELSRSNINSVSLLSGMAIVAIVGEGMALTSGVSSTFMSSLARANVNIRLITQGSSERQVAVVVEGTATSRALRAAHMAFTLSETVASVTILGSTGYIGSALVKELSEQKQMLHDDLGVEICPYAAACSTKMVLADDTRGFDIERLSELIQADDCPDFDLDVLTDTLIQDVHPLQVIIDCTNSEQVSDYYERWFSAGIHIISPSRKVAAGPMDRYRRVCQARRDNNVYWQFESAVGSALPIITTLTDLLETGDKIKTIKGCVSGTMAYVLRTFSDEVPFSEAVRQATKMGFAETDFREDLSGLETARKVVILARLIGLNTNMEDVSAESLLPDDIMDKEYSFDDDSLLNDIKCVDDAMRQKLKSAEDAGRALRYKFVIDAETGKCKCGLEAVPNSDPLFRLKTDENLVAFETSRYKTSPLIVKGAAAGPELAATGIFTDLLRLTRAYSSLQD